MKEQLEKDLAEYQEMQVKTEFNLHRLDALITYIKEKLEQLNEEQVKEKTNESDFNTD